MGAFARVRRRAQRGGAALRAPEAAGCGGPDGGHAGRHALPGRRHRGDDGGAAAPQVVRDQELAVLAGDPGDGWRVCGRGAAGAALGGAVPPAGVPPRGALRDPADRACRQARRGRLPGPAAAQRRGDGGHRRPGSAQCARQRQQQRLRRVGPLPAASLPRAQRDPERRRRRRARRRGRGRGRGRPAGRGCADVVRYWPWGGAAGRPAQGRPARLCGARFHVPPDHDGLPEELRSRCQRHGQCCGALHRHPGTLHPWRR
mmetsp:Transcript_9309/g.23743  ORF Transcript_9309/g.23743 Transcript_9309/m.23743 type:complete len:259 (-) Transcript_9309:458-1234(-)